MVSSDAAAPEELAGLVSWFAGWTWPVDADEARRRVEQRGWTLQEGEAGGSAQWTTGLIASKAWAFDSVVKGAVADLTVITANVRESDQRRATRQLRDIFVDQVSTVTQVLGDPSARTPGPDAAVEWALSNSSGLWLGMTGRLCTCVLTSPRFVTIERDLGPSA